MVFYRGEDTPTNYYTTHSIWTLEYITCFCSVILLLFDSTYSTCPTCSVLFFHGLTFIFVFLTFEVLSSTDFPARVKVHFSMKLTYRTPEYDYDNETLDSEAAESLTENEVASHPKKQWDDDCPWAEWYSAEDPVKGNWSLMIFTRNLNKQP